MRTTRATIAILAMTLLAVLSCALAACAGGSGPAASSAAPTGAPFTTATSVLAPAVNPEGDAIDITHVADGYVVAHASSAARLKFQVTKDSMSYNYDLANDGTPSVYPINMGDGSYRFRIMQNTDGNNYIEIKAVEADVKLSSEFAPFLIPNVFCSYNENSACVAKAREVTADATNEGEAVQRICTYVIDNIAYDTDKARALTSVNGYLPNPDETLASGTGICFDYASLGAAMLRSQGIPAKIITGYVSPGDLYHAWIMVYADGTWNTAEFSVDRDTWSRVDLTFAASGATAYTGDGADYTERYVY